MDLNSQVYVSSWFVYKDTVSSLLPSLSPSYRTSSHNLYLWNACEQYCGSHCRESQSNQPDNPSQNQNKTLPRKKQQQHTRVSFLSQTLIIMISQNSDNWGNCGLFCVFDLISWVTLLVLIIYGVVEPKHYAIPALGGLRQITLSLWFSIIKFSSIIYILYISKVPSIIKLWKCYEDWMKSYL